MVIDKLIQLKIHNNNKLD